MAKGRQHIVNGQTDEILIKDIKMKPQNNENEYLIEDISSFCSSVQINEPVNATKTISIDELGPAYCKTVVKQAKDQ